MRPTPYGPFPQLRFVVSSAIALMLLLLLYQFGAVVRIKRNAGAMTAMVCLLVWGSIGIAGCGGGSAMAQAATAVTPSRTYTITVTPTATSRQFPLSGISLTLIVK